MHTHAKLALAGFAATLALGTSATGAAANRLFLSEQRFSVAWSRLRYAFEGEPSPGCAVTLSGSFHGRTITKTQGSLVGVITGAQEGAECDELNLLPETLPWHVRYRHFRGRLPAITSIGVDIVGVAILFPGAIDCLITTEAAEPLRGMFLLNGSGRSTAYVIDETLQIDLFDEWTCELVGDVFFSGTGSVSPSLTVTLI